VETREDEEQNIKLSEILELLVAAGYFRARIKGLSPFDKVKGTFRALTEKIVSVLPRMKCPHRLEPHQIQGLDFIHIFPVVQWLVKRAIETREEMGDYIRSYSISQFQKTHNLPEDDDFMQRKEKAVRAVSEITEVYKPQRKYQRRSGAEKLIDEESKVHATLLEYGRRYGFSRQGKPEKAEDKKMVLPAGLVSAGKPDAYTEDDLQAAEEMRIKTLMTEMAAMGTEEQSELSAEERPERLGAVQQHKRKVALLSKQIAQKTKQLEEIKYADLQAASSEAKKTLNEVKNYSEKLDKELAVLEMVESQADSK
ncbi:hypothetical protein JD844_022514, partial [Phrynosoma platyrhinos]